VNITIDANFGKIASPVTDTVLDFSDNAARKVIKLIEEEGNRKLKLRVSVMVADARVFSTRFRSTRNLKMATKRSRIWVSAW